MSEPRKKGAIMATIRSRHAQRAHLTASTQKTIPGTVIFGRYVTCLGLPPNVDLTKKLSSILGGGAVKWDLGLKLMAFTPFKNDGLILQKVDVMRANTIGDLGDLVFSWYRNNGWTVT
jgi:hypothetical protein